MNDLLLQGSQSAVWTCLGCFYFSQPGLAILSSTVRVLLGRVPRLYQTHLWFVGFGFRNFLPGLECFKNAKPNSAKLAGGPFHEMPRISDASKVFYSSFKLQHVWNFNIFNYICFFKIAAFHES